MRLLVCGSREFTNAALMRSWFKALLHPGDVVIHGGARGADVMAGTLAIEFLMNMEVYLADWKRHGRKAGPIRNTLMLREGKPDCVLAFPGRGPGTRDMMDKALRAGLRVIDGNADGPIAEVLNLVRQNLRENPPTKVWR